MAGQGLADGSCPSNTEARKSSSSTMGGVVVGFRVEGLGLGFTVGGSWGRSK